MRTFEQALGLTKKPIAIGFFDDEPPAGVEQWAGGAVPAGCAFWREAWEGRTFYTVTADHCNCAVGAYTHKIPQPPERETALNDTIGFMISSGYLQMSEVPMIPVLPKTPRYIAYGPADEGRFRADVVVVVANPAAMMLIYEAALRAGVGNLATPALGRPACAVLPMAINTGATAMSFLDARGNRTFTWTARDRTISRESRHEVGRGCGCAAQRHKRQRHDGSPLQEARSHGARPRFLVS